MPAIVPLDRETQKGTLLVVSAGMLKAMGFEFRQLEPITTAFICQSGINRFNLQPCHCISDFWPKFH